MARRSSPREMRVRVIAAEMRLYRACRLSDADWLAEPFRSHYEEQRPPRGVETWAPMLHMAVSMFEAPEPCWNLIERTRGRIGDQVAEVVLGPDHGICIARTGGACHWSVWDRPGVLQAAIRGTVSGQR